MILPQNYDALDRYKRREVREEYIKKQGGKCYHCGADLEKQPCSSVRCLPVTEKLFPPGFFKYPVHLHHDHNTGLTIGAVHAYCNAVLWEHHGE